MQGISCDDDECVGRGQSLSECGELGCRCRSECRMHCRKGYLGGIYDVDRQSAVVGGHIGEPVGDGRGEPAFSRAADNDL